MRDQVFLLFTGQRPLRNGFLFFLYIKKWLSYRAKAVVGRDITKDEAREFTRIVRRIGALLLLEPKLDKNYAAIKANCYSWSAASAQEDV